MTRLGLLLVLLAVISLPLAARQPAPAFEVVSIKPNSALDRSGMISAPTGSQFRVVNIALRMIVLYAYNRRDLELVDAPAWTSSERFNITATYPATASHTLEEARQMMQRVLAERFRLRVHEEMRELPVYRLIKARDDGTLGPKLIASDVDCAKWLAEKRPQIIGTPPISPTGARPACMMVAQRNFIVGGTRQVAELAKSLEFAVERPVIDATGLSGNFNIELLWTPTPGLDAQPNAAAAAATETVSVFTAIQEQLGLKLEPARAPARVLVIDSVERPAAD